MNVKCLFIVASKPKLDSSHVQFYILHFTKGTPSVAHFTRTVAHSHIILYGHYFDVTTGIGHCPIGSSNLLAFEKNITKCSLDLPCVCEQKEAPSAPLNAGK